jgi:BirA family transcriptional regulator, biotin operon repressor / biotin---[acetyl-CoA-carboxylase] ligase
MQSPFNVQQFSTQITTKWLGKTIHVFDELPSTNSYLKDHDGRCREHQSRPSDGAIVLAEHQSAGRGQRDRVWETNRGQNITCSFCYHPHQLKRLPSITLVVAVACARALEHCLHMPVQIKWPNDIYVNYHKLGGILIESSLIGDRVDNLIVGIGLNVHQTVFDNTRFRATSVETIFSQIQPNKPVPSREDILAAMCNELECYLDDWDSGKPLPRHEAHERLIGYGLYGYVEVNDVKSEDLVKFMGIDNDGYPTFVTWDGDILRYRHEQVRFHPETMPEL